MATFTILACSALTLSPLLGPDLGSQYIGATSFAKAAVVIQQQSVEDDVDWAFFVERSTAKYAKNLDSSSDWEDVLWRNGQNGATRAEAVAGFASDLNLPEDLAVQYADAIIAVIVEDRSKACTDYRSQTPCLVTSSGDIYLSVRDLALSEPSGELLFFLETAVSRADGEPEEERRVRSLAAHSNSDELLARLYAYARTGTAVAILIDRDTLTATSVREALERAGRQGSFHQSDLVAQMDAALSRRYEENSGLMADPARRAAGLQLLLELRLTSGESDDAVALWRSLSPRDRRGIPVTCAEDDEEKACRNLEDSGRLTMENLATALSLAGRTRQARRLLAEMPAPQGAFAAYRAALVADALTPLYDRDSLFEVYTEGKLNGAWLIDSNEQEYPSSNTAGIEAARSFDPPMRDAVARRLERAGFADMARYLRQDRFSAREYDQTLMADMLSLETQSYLPDAIARWDQLWINPPREDIADGPVRVVAQTLRRWWTEERLPDGVEPWGDDDEVSAEPPDIFSVLPMQGWVVRFTQQGEEWQAIVVSSAYDMTGEVGAPGYWYIETKDGSWQPPLYLGLQAYLPYIFTEDSRLPLLDGETLQIEARIREIDTSSISFPPIGTAIKRQADGILVKINLSDIRRDTDNDGMTDIAEARIGLDLREADTDGDGIPDGQDTLPLNPFRSDAPPNDREIANAILSVLYGQDRAALVVTPGSSALIDALGTKGPWQADTMMIVTPRPEIFDVVETTFPLIVYTPADIAELDRGGPFYPPEILAHFTSPDGLTHFVEWSAQWQGGTFVVRCDEAGTCETEVTRSWIT